MNERPEDSGAPDLFRGGGPPQPQSRLSSCTTEPAHLQMYGPRRAASTESTAVATLPRTSRSPNQEGRHVNSSLHLNGCFWKRELDFEFCLIIFADFWGPSPSRKRVHDMKTGRRCPGGGDQLGPRAGPQPPQKGPLRLWILQGQAQLYASPRPALRKPAQ